MNKPDIKEVLAIAEMKQQARALYEEIDNRIATIKSEYGAGRFDYDLENHVAKSNGKVSEYCLGALDDAPYLKFEITDNAEKLASGESLFSKMCFKPVVFEFRGLKRCPDSLK